MHDIDQTMLEFEDDPDNEYEDDYEAFESDDDSETDDNVLSEEEEMEAASDLLNVNSEEELERFLGGLFKKIARKIHHVTRLPIVRKLATVLKPIAKKVLPMAGAAVGNIFAPGVGGAIGGKLASTAGKIFGLELEGMSPEDMEYESARRFVRLAASAASNAAKTSPNIPPSKAARIALIKAAKAHAPGLIFNPERTFNGYRSGRWIKRGHKIILLGV